MRIRRPLWTVLALAIAGFAVWEQAGRPDLGRMLGREPVDDCCAPGAKKPPAPGRTASAEPGLPAERPPATDGAANSGDAALEKLFAARSSDAEIEIEGSVERVLAEDRDGSPHQRFLVRLASGRTVLVAHNLALAPRVPLEGGDRVTVRGEYEWNEKGGVVHWTHHDPRGNRPGGWIRHDGELYR